MPFEISPTFAPTAPVFPIGPLTDARRRCLRLAGLIREGCLGVKESYSYHGCAVGAAHFAAAGHVDYSHRMNYVEEIAEMTATPRNLIQAVSDAHSANYRHRSPERDSRPDLADQLERGDFDKHAN